MTTHKEKFKSYKTELINGSKGIINIPIDKDLEEILSTRQFIKDMYTEHVIRSSSIVKYKYIGIHELDIQPSNN